MIFTQPGGRKCVCVCVCVCVCGEGGGGGYHWPAVIWQNYVSRFLAISRYSRLKFKGSTQWQNNAFLHPRTHCLQLKTVWISLKVHLSAEILWKVWCTFLFFRPSLGVPVSIFETRPWPMKHCDEIVITGSGPSLRASTLPLYYVINRLPRCGRSWVRAANQLASSP